MDLQIVILIGILSGIVTCAAVTSKPDVLTLTPKSIQADKKVLAPIPVYDILIESQEYNNTDQLAHTEDDTSVADAMKKIKVLCWVMTCPNNHKRKAVHIKQTWGKRCNKLLFMSSAEDPDLPTVKLPGVAEPYSWDMTKEAYRYIYQQHLFDADWFLQVDDTTYVIVENLRYMLLDYNTHDAIYFGSSVRNPPNYRTKMFRNRQSGVVLGREAVTRFIMEDSKVPSRCREDPDSVDDEQFARCFNHIGVKAVDTRDAYKRGRLFPFAPHDHLNSKVENDWYWTNIHRIKTGRYCCSEYAISFHYVNADLMYVLEYFVYHLRPYGISYNF